MQKNLEQPGELTPDQPAGKKPAIGGVGNRLYTITERDGSFEVVFPGLLDTKRGQTVGTTTEIFLTREAAEAAVVQTRESTRTMLEFASLEKSFGQSCWRIDRGADGRFVVTTPGFGSKRDGFFIGTSRREFTNWDEAKTHFLESQKDLEKITHQPILEITTGHNEAVAFSSAEGFNPQVTPSDQAQPIPASIEKYLTGEGRLEALNYETLFRPLPQPNQRQLT
ncbi:hypothetical protein HY933_01245 [Candidatus Falkowbacteria bacterium]|nr:hypothetical protein [Candidatus Falkowbacteria bacterium]